MATKVKSKISGNEVTQAQYLTELVCSRLYKKKEGKQAQAGFWSDSHYWTNQYKNQIIKANTLLRMYNFNVICRVLEQESWCFSLHNKQLSQKFVDEQKKYDTKTNTLKDKKIEISESNSFRTKQFGKKKNKLGKLKDWE